MICGSWVPSIFPSGTGMCTQGCPEMVIFYRSAMFSSLEIKLVQKRWWFSAGVGRAMSGDIFDHHNWKLILASGEWRSGMLGYCWTSPMPMTAPRTNSCLIRNINKTRGIKSVPLSVCPPSMNMLREGDLGPHPRMGLVTRRTDPVLEAWNLQSHP